MRTPTRSILALAGLLFTFLLTSQHALAIKSMNCPKEPATGTPIASGDVYSGSNCELYTADDVDSFVFNANKGDTWRIILAWLGSYPGTCMALYDPNGNNVYPTTCTGDGELIASQTLAVTGQYTIVLTMEGDSSDALYALSLERTNPFPPDAQSISVNQAITGTTSPPTSQPTYTFYGVTTGTYKVSASWTGGEAGICEYLYYPGSATAQPAPDQGCSGDGTYSFTFTPPSNATYMVLLDSQGDATGSYSFEVSCYLGTCTPPPPVCVLKDAPTYNATTGTLTMDFTLATPVAATWDAWLINHNTSTQLWSQSEPITDNPVNLTKTETKVPKEGVLGILSTLTVPTTTTTTGGITCSSWVYVNTGKP